MDENGTDYFYGSNQCFFCAKIRKINAVFMQNCVRKEKLMNYIETIFWIEPTYDEMHGWLDKETANAYYQELKELLENAQ